MKKLIIFVALFFALNRANAQPPNNPIFYGGDGDGIARSSYLQSSVNNQLGGDGDGIAMASYLQPSTNIQVGGDGDGWHAGNYAQLADASLFFGGDGDGLTMQTYQSIADQALFYGGPGDGWASIVYALGPLPVTLLSFNGEEKEGQHHLYWKTSTEENTSHFVIEHSADAKLFKELGMTNAAGNSQEEKEYRFANKTPLLGNNFYRLKMVDIDGKFTYSNVVLLNVLKDKTTILLYPNPSATQLNIELQNLPVQANVSMRIIDITGKTIWSSQSKYQGRSYQINISEFASGLYQLIIGYGNEKQVIKFRRL